jgi:hypothetical protein
MIVIYTMVILALGALAGVFWHRKSWVHFVAVVVAVFLLSIFLQGTADFVLHNRPYALGGCYNRF